MADLTFKANLLPNTDLGKALGSSTQRWNIYGNLTGNADTATKWETAKTITIGYKSQDIDGSSNITYDLHDIALSDTILRTTTSWNQTSPGVYGVASGEAFSGEGNPESANGGLAPYRYGQLLVFKAGTYGLTQLYISHHDNDAAYGIKFRSGWNGTYNTAWNTLLDSANYTQYTVTKTGSGASGTWGISITGNAATASALTSLGTIGSSTTTHATALQNYFNTYKASTPRNQLINFYDSSSGNGSITFGYFLNGYDSTPYGGFFSAHYNWAYYTGINNGAYTQYLLAKSTGSVGNSNTPIYVDGNGNLQACNNKLGAVYANNYWGMATADNNTGGWIRTTSQGIIPYQSGSKGGGHQYLGTSSWYFAYAYIDNVYSSKTYGAVWNDYAEFRITKEEIEPGRCIKEVGDDTMVLTTKRLEAGCEIVSDTYGFAIGETDKAKTPTAASGRVLAYPYENREEFRNHIGEPVCSGPNGTVSIMTHEEEKEWPSRIIGTISAIPDYEVWHAGGDGENSTPIKVNGRIWIRIR